MLLQWYVLVYGWGCGIQEDLKIAVLLKGEYIFKNVLASFIMGSLFLYGKKKESHYICVVVAGCSFSFSERVVRVLFFFYFLSLSFGGGDALK